MTDRNMYFFLFNLEFPMWLPRALKMADAYKDWGKMWCAEQNVFDGMNEETILTDEADCHA